MRNFLLETESAIVKTDHTSDDIIFIGSTDGYSCTWQEFKGSLADFEYDPGFGGQEVASDLIIIFNDNTWLDRGEYDGSEWWEFHKCPAVPEARIPIKQLYCEDEYWRSLEDLHND